MSSHKGRSRKSSSFRLPTFAFGKRNRTVLRSIPEPLTARNMHEEDYYETMMSDKEKARAFVDAQEWIFAKTMADIPHFFLFFLCGFCE